MARILIAEDDEPVRIWLSEALSLEGHNVDVAVDGQEAIDQFDPNRHNLVLLDVTMPRMNGLEACRRLRSQDKELPIMILSARDTEDDKVTGLELGADDYMTKPFSLRELSARVNALLRRSRSAFGTIMIGNTVFDRKSRSLACKGIPPQGLTDKEYKLMDMLVMRTGEVLSRDELLNEIWGIEYYGTTRTLDQHIATLRKKLGPEGVRIESVRNAGYRLRNP